jgi:hypothetical protein
VNACFNFLVAYDYGRATRYGYLGWLYQDKGDKKTAKDYLTRGYNLSKSIGAEMYAILVLSDIQELEKDWINSLEEVTCERVKFFFRGNLLFRIKSKIISRSLLRHYF